VLDWDQVSLAGAESDLAWWAVMDYEHTETVGVARPAGIGSPNDTVRLWQECVGREARDLWFHSVYANYRLAVILVRLADLLADALPPEVVNEFLEIPTPTQPREWPGLSA
jgi:aminoglycoside phosphotransferase (APT) family kinase protein